MKPVPSSECGKICHKLEDKVALITCGECLHTCGDLKNPSFAKYCVDRTIEYFGYTT